LTYTDPTGNRTCRTPSDSRLCDQPEPKDESSFEETGSGGPGGNGPGGLNGSNDGSSGSNGCSDLQGHDVCGTQPTTGNPNQGPPLDIVSGGSDRGDRGRSTANNAQEESARNSNQEPPVMQAVGSDGEVIDEQVVFGFPSESNGGRSFNIARGIAANIVAFYGFDGTAEVGFSVDLDNFGNSRPFIRGSFAVLFGGFFASASKTGALGFSPLPKKGFSQNQSLTILAEGGEFAVFGLSTDFDLNTFADNGVASLNVARGRAGVGLSSGVGAAAGIRQNVQFTGPSINEALQFARDAINDIIDSIIDGEN